MAFTSLASTSHNGHTFSHNQGADWEHFAIFPTTLICLVQSELFRTVNQTTLFENSELVTFKSVLIEHRASENLTTKCCLIVSDWFLISFYWLVSPTTRFTCWCNEHSGLRTLDLSSIYSLLQVRQSYRLWLECRSIWHLDYTQRAHCAMNGFQRVHIIQNNTYCVRQKTVRATP